jgi:hypothetical protein
MFVGVGAVRLGIPVHGVSHFSYKIIQLQTGLLFFFFFVAFLDYFSGPLLAMLPF